MFYKLNTAKDLFNKSLVEFSYFNDEVLEDSQSYILFNVIISLNHLLEWYLSDTDIDKNKKIDALYFFYPCRNDENPPEIINNTMNKYKIIKENLCCNFNQRILRLMSNKLKHIKIKKAKRDIDIINYNNYTTTAGSGVYAGAGFYAGQFDKYFYYILNDDKEINLVEAIKDKNIQKEWAPFFD